MPEGRAHPWRPVLAPPAVIALAIWLMLGNLAQMLSCVFWPVWRSAFRVVNAWIAGSWWWACVRTAAWLHGTTLVATGDKLPYAEDAVVIANHQNMPDITFLMELARRHGRLGNMKWIVKNALKWVPGVGWGMVFLECVFIKRQWLEDQEKMRRAFQALSRARVPVWFLSFPEGTRFTAAKAERSRAYAQERGVEPLQRVLMPRDKGFASTVRGLEHAAAVYDVTIGYPLGAPTMWQYVVGAPPGTVAHVHVVRYPKESVPTGEAEIAEWLLARFREKDRLLEEFQRTGAFPERTG